MKVLFIRHAETEVNTRSAVHKKGDEARLTDLGKKQADLLSKACGCYGISVIYTSPEHRAKETAEYIAKDDNIPLKTVADLGERNWGKWSGRPWNDIKAELDKMDTETRYNFVPPRGESWRQMEDRLNRFIKNLIKSNEDGVAVISHGGLMRALMPLINQDPKETSFEYDFDNASITYYEFDGKWKALKINNTDHLRTNFKQLIQDVESLHLPLGSYALFGSTPIIVRGIREASHDIDIIVDDKLWHEYKNMPNWVMQPIRDDFYLEWEGHNIELWKTWGPGQWNIGKLIKEAEIINGLPFVKLETVLEWKKINGRPKDLTDVTLVEDYINRQH